jgi:hypothetical protein
MRYAVVVTRISGDRPHHVGKINTPTREEAEDIAALFNGYDLHTYNQYSATVHVRMLSRNKSTLVPIEALEQLVDDLTKPQDPFADDLPPMQEQKVPKRREWSTPANDNRPPKTMDEIQKELEDEAFEHRVMPT